MKSKTSLLILTFCLLAAPSAQAVVGVAGALTGINYDGISDAITAGLVLERRGDKLIITNCGKTWEPKPGCADAQTHEIPWSEYVQRPAFDTGSYKRDESGVKEAEFDLAAAEAQGNQAKIKKIKGQLSHLRTILELTSKVASSDYSLVDQRTDKFGFTIYTIGIRYRVKSGWIPVGGKFIGAPFMGHGFEFSNDLTGDKNFTNETGSKVTAVKVLVASVVESDNEFCREEGARVSSVRASYTNGQSKTYRPNAKPGDVIDIDPGLVRALSFSVSVLDIHCITYGFFAYCDGDCLFPVGMMGYGR